MANVFILRAPLLEHLCYRTLAVRLSYLKREDVLEAWDLCQRVGQLLNALIGALRKGPGARGPGPEGGKASPA